MSVTAVEAKVIGEGGGEMGDIALVSLTLSEGAAADLPRKMVCMHAYYMCRCMHIYDSMHAPASEDGRKV